MNFLRIILSALISMSVLFSCNDAEQRNSNTAAVLQKEISEADSLSVQFTDTAEIAGIYQGKFPCLDCEGYEQSILLKHNGRYKQAYLNMDSNIIKSHTTGIWEVEEGRIVLTESNQKRLVFEYINDGLMAISIDGIQITDPSRYLLSRKPFGGDIKKYEAEMRRDVLFRARGNEPFWSLRIESNSVAFKLADWKNEIRSPILQSEKVNDSTIYHLKNDGKEWSVAFSDQFCRDGMSDLIYEYEVIVNFGDKQYRGCGIDFQAR